MPKLKQTGTGRIDYRGDVPLVDLVTEVARLKRKTVTDYVTGALIAQLERDGFPIPDPPPVTASTRPKVVRTRKQTTKKGG